MDLTKRHANPAIKTTIWPVVKVRLDWLPTFTLLNSSAMAVTTLIAQNTLAN
jgi:hypothetical protein